METRGERVWQEERRRRWGMERSEEGEGEAERRRGGGVVLGTQRNKTQGSIVGEGPTHRALKYVILSSN